MIEVAGVPIFAEIEDIVKALQQEDPTIKSKETNHSIMITCPSPNHNDSTPSCGICYETHTNYKGDTVLAGAVNCFGCEYSGSVVDVVSDVLNITYPQAIKWIVSNFVTGEYNQRKIEIDINRNRNEVKEFEYKSDEFYSYHEYMEERGITIEMADLFQVRYDPKTHSLVFPVFSRDFEIVGYQKKGIDSRWNDTQGNTNTLYGKHLLEKNNELWLTEGAIDAIIVYRSGKDVVATLGSLSGEQIEEIKRLNYRVIVCAFDNDKAGDIYSKKIAAEFKNSLVKRAFFKNGDDPGDTPNIDDFEYELKYMT